jgi:hypothetical protein
MVAVPLRRIVSRVESGDNFFALRFEPKVYARFTEAERKSSTLAFIAKVNRCSIETAMMIFSTSWGAYQIMGSNLYQVCSLKIEIGMFMSIRSQQLDAFDIFVQGHIADYDPETATWKSAAALLEFAAFYNGPGQPEVYAAELTKAAGELRG